MQVRHVFNVHVDAVQVVLFHRLGNLVCQLLPVFQRFDSQGPIPVVAQKRDHPDTPGMHLGDKIGNAGVCNIQRSVFVQVKIVGGNFVQSSSGLLHPLDIGGG